MPKHIIEFNIPEEQDALDLTLRAGDYSMMLHDFSQWLRAEVKYGPSEDLRADIGALGFSPEPEQIEAVLQVIRDKYWDIVTAHGGTE